MKSQKVFFFSNEILKIFTWPKGCTQKILMFQNASKLRGFGANKKKFTKCLSIILEFANAIQRSTYQNFPIPSWLLCSSRLIWYREESIILYQYQFGVCRKNRSIEHGLTKLVEQIRLNIGRNQMICWIFIDLSKVFETVNRKILTDKFEHYGIRSKKKTLDIFKSYLCNYKQCIHFDNSKSTVHPTSAGELCKFLSLGHFLYFIHKCKTFCRWHHNLSFTKKQHK